MNRWSAEELTRTFSSIHICTVYTITSVLSLLVKHNCPFLVLVSGLACTDNEISTVDIHYYESSQLSENCCYKKHSL